MQNRGDNHLIAITTSYGLPSNAWLGTSGETAQQIASLVRERNADVNLGTFPARFTAYNDLALDHVVNELILQQQSLLQAVRDGYDTITQDTETLQLMKCLADSEEEHLQMLKELCSKQSSCEPQVAADSMDENHNESVLTCAA